MRARVMPVLPLPRREVANIKRLAGRGRSRYTACEARRMGHGDSKAQRNRYSFSVSWCLGGRYPPCLAARVDFHHGLLAVSKEPSDETRKDAPGARHRSRTRL